MKKFVRQVARWGVSEDMPQQQQIMVIFINQFVGIAFVLQSFLVLFFIVTKIYTNVVFFCINLLLCMGILLLNKAKKTHFSQTLIGFFPLVMMSMSLLAKVEHGAYLNYVIPPRLSILFLTAFPYFLYNGRNLKPIFLNSIAGIICLVFFEEIHLLVLGIEDIYSLPVDPPNFIFRIVHIIIFIALVANILSIGGVNRYFEAKVTQLLKLTQEKNEELSLQNDIIAEKNTQITDSIYYAKRIQAAMLPAEQRFEQLFGKNNFFVLSRPRDIVSGDFYWLNNNTLAIVDCTGHGVPGAFMSMIGNDAINAAVLQNNKTQPTDILFELDKSINETLNQQATQNRDGMDIAVVSVDQKTKTLHFSGANHPLLYFQDAKINLIKGDRYGTGGFWENETPKTFTQHDVSFENAKTNFYLFSDGYRDQFGGENNKKFTTKRFYELIQSVQHLPMNKQAEVLQTTIKNWIETGNEKQIDDILVVGFCLG